MRLTGVLVRQYELFTVASGLSLFIGCPLYSISIHIYNIQILYI